MQPLSLATTPLGLDAAPATIDIRAEVIGRHAVEQLVWRINHWDGSERVRIMIASVLVDSADTHAVAGI